MVISDFAIKRPVVTVVTMLALVVFGAWLCADRAYRDWLEAEEAAARRIPPKDDVAAETDLGPAVKAP